MATNIVEVGGHPHAYELTPTTQSPSPVLVFVHGWLLSRAYWQPVVEQLADDFRCLTYDLRGFGGSQMQQVDTSSNPSAAVSTSMEALPGYTPADYARDLTELLQRLQLDKVWLVGHSLGGSIALWAAEQMPDRVKGVICVNSGGGIYLKEEFERFRAAGEKLVKLRPRWLCYLPLLDVMMSWMNVASPLSLAWGRQRLLDWTVAERDAALGALLESTTEDEVHRLPQVVSRLQQPVYFITGQKDTVMEPQYVQHLASFHPLFQSEEGNVIQIPNCGHLAMLERTDSVVENIQTILTRHRQTAQQA
ncbi:alpha/beta hydrolase [filamentous cyanobacterium LEGE 07170]|nr:alpha/beta hydrolase [filamentous cyanobacterium LEGE 07170]